MDTAEVCSKGLHDLRQILIEELQPDSEGDDETCQEQLERLEREDVARIQEEDAARIQEEKEREVKRRRLQEEAADREQRERQAMFKEDPREQQRQQECRETMAAVCALLFGDE